MPVPIDRSMPPVMITKVVPSARMPVTVAAVRIETRLLAVKKCELANEKNTTITMRLAAARNCWSEPRRRANRGVPASIAA